MSLEKIASTLALLQRAYLTLLLAFVAVIGVSMALLLPPFQAPDEGAHWTTAVRRLSRLVTGEAETCAAALALPDALEAGRLPFRPDVKVRTGRIASLDRAGSRCDAKPTEHYGIAFTYPGVIVANQYQDILHSDGFGALKAFFLSRLFHGLLIIGLLARLACLARGRYRVVPGLALLAGVAVSPLFLQASFTISADVITNASVLALTGLLLAGRQVGWLDLVLAAGIGAVGAATKYTNAPIYAAFGFAILLLHGREGTRRTRLAGGIGIALAVLCGLFFAAVSSRLNLNGQNDPTIDAGRQVAYVIQNPDRFLTALGDLITKLAIITPWLGPLGWLDAAVPASAVRAWSSLAWTAAALDLLALLAVVLSLWRQDSLPRSGALIRAGLANLALIAGVVLGFAAPAFAMYLVWTPVGNAEILGFQARYSFPAVILALATLMSWTVVLEPGDGASKTPMSWQRPVWLVGLRTAVGLMMVGAALRYLVSLLTALLARYY